MSATVVGEKNETTLPADVLNAAGIRPKDQVDWSYEDGKIVGRKMVEQGGNKPRFMLVERNGRHMLVGDVSREEILAAIRADRERK